MPLNLHRSERANDRSAAIEYDRLFAAHDEIEVLKRAYIDDAAINNADDFTGHDDGMNAEALAELNVIRNSSETPAEKWAQARAVLDRLIEAAADAYAHR